MGSHNFSNVGYGKTAKEAYNDLVDQALWEYGHDPYNGTISTTCGFIMTSIDQKRVTQQAIDRWLEKAWEQTDKHVPCHCLELPRSHAKGKPRGVRAFIFAGWANS